jgi:small-conductance mechanosensitive channel
METIERIYEYFDKHPVLLNSLTFIAILVVSYLVSRMVRMMFVSFVRKQELQHSDTTYANFLKNISQGIILLVGFCIAVYAIPPLRALSVSLLASAGILAAILGFASQQTFANFISGVFIVLFKPIRVHDYVEIDGKYYGYVEDITLRHTIIRNIQGVRIVIPNSVLNNVIVINYHLNDTHVCALIELLFEYGQDLDFIIEQIQDEALKHPLTLDRRTEAEKETNEPIVRVRVIRANEKGVLLRVFVWGRDADDSYRLRTDLTKLIVQRLIENGVKFAEIRI